MSLIYDALKEPAGPAAPAPARSPASWWRQRSQRARTGIVLGTAALAVAGALAYATAPRADRAAPVPAAAAAPSVPLPDAPAPAAPALLAPVPEAAPEAAAVMQPSPSADVMPAAPAAPAPLQAEAGPAPAVTMPPPAVASTEAPDTAPPAVAAPAPAQAAAPISIKVERHGGGPAPTAGDDRAVTLAVGEIEAAMAAEDLAGARQSLARLQALLPDESLTLLRMQAWIAHAGNETASAERLYRAIAERVPDDATAGVNIALLDARRGDLEAARRRLTQLSGRHPRSSQIAHALAELDRQPQ
ncbi:tetratricopeptide repeat protein [Stenotrophomonas mori]|uniref:Tetratricopeptide repeat protein n=1 Tax=Stenotrophomonas mori TaxID=2871096 RepID=A0ABT0SJ77_9GAMM|nr:hypothetical protein [Stenotrophomonas mori]MCL7715153.1 hypothetical protein [Stenotrophomonas mori]